MSGGCHGVLRTSDKDAGTDTLARVSGMETHQRSDSGEVR
jgi:hypothetical protein